MTNNQNENKKDLRNLIIGGVAGLVILFIIIFAVNGGKDKEIAQNEDTQQAENVSTELTEEEYLEMARKGVESDKNYSYQVKSPEWVHTLNKDEVTFVYYFSPVCKYCIETTPSVITGLNEATKEIDKDFNFIQVDVTLDSDIYYDIAQLEGTPTMVKYVNGVEVERVAGSGYPSTFYKDWFDGNDITKDFVDKTNENYSLREFTKSVEFVEGEKPEVTEDEQEEVTEKDTK